MLDLTEPIAHFPAAVRPANASVSACDLDRVAERRAGAVRLDVADAVHLDAGAADRVGDEHGLRGRAGHGEPGGPSGVVDRRPLEDAVHVVTVGERPRQRLQHHRADALARHVSVAVAAEATAAAVGGQELALRELEVLLRMRRHVDPTGQRQVALPAPDALGGEVHGGQGRRAGGVDGHAGTGEVQAVRHPVGHRGVHRRGRDAVAAGLHHLVVVPHDAGEDAHRAPRQCGRRVPGVLEGVPADHEEQPLLGVHPLGLAPRDAEEGRVEMADPVEEATPAPVGAARPGPRVRVVEPAVVPPVRRYPGHAVPTGDQVRPEGVQVGGQRVPPREPDHRDVVRRRRDDRIARGHRHDRSRACGVGLGLLGRGQEIGEPAGGAVRHHQPHLGARQAPLQHVESGRGGHRLGAQVAPGPPVGLRRDSHASVGPQRPGDGERPAAAVGPCRPALGEGVEEAVGVGVVGLAGVADGGGERREDREEVEVVAGGRRVDRLHARDLGGEHVGHVVRPLAEVQSVAHGAGGVDHAVDPPECGTHLVERHVELVAPADVGAQIAHPGALLLPVAQLRPAAGAQRAPPDQRDPGPAGANEVVGDQAGEGATAAGDDVHAFLAQRYRPLARGHRQVSPDVPPPVHVPDRGFVVGRPQLGEQRGGHGVGRGGGEADGGAAQHRRLGTDRAAQRGRRVGAGRDTVLGVEMHGEQPARCGGLPVDHGGGDRPQHVEVAQRGGRRVRPVRRARHHDDGRAAAVPLVDGVEQPSHVVRAGRVEPEPVAGRSGERGAVGHGDDPPSAEPLPQRVEQAVVRADDHERPRVRRTGAVRR